MTPPRRSPLRLLALLVAYGLVLGGSPVGQAGYLWVHLGTAHHEPAGRLSPMVEAMEREALALVGHGPHEHDGVVHSHGDDPAEDPIVPAGLSKYYLAAYAAPAPSLLREGPSTLWTAPRFARPSVPVESPPPRVSG